MIETEKDALEQIMNILGEIDAKDLVEDIEVIIARGKVEEIESNNKTKEFAQVPLTTKEAVQVAINMIISSLEPILMIEPTLNELSPNNEATLRWARDYVEKSPLDFKSDNVKDIKDLNILKKLAPQIKGIIDILKENMDAKLQ